MNLQGTSIVDAVRFCNNNKSVKYSVVETEDLMALVNGYKELLDFIQKLHEEFKESD